MRRRYFLYAGAGWGASLLLNPMAAASPLTVTWLGHMSFLFQDGKRRIFTHPFKAVGCNTGRPTPKQAADLVLVSSALLDEGFVENVPDTTPILSQPGSYNLLGITFQGIRMAHDRSGGRRFGFNVAWRWQQGGINILHLGGAAAPFLPEERILMGRPDIAIVPVGGGAKAYTPEEAKTAITNLNPKVVIPVHYRPPKADPATCDLQPLSDFLSLFPAEMVNRLKGNTTSWTAAQLPQTMQIVVFAEAPAPQRNPTPKRP